MHKPAQMPAAALLVGAVTCALLSLAAGKDLTFEGPLDSFALCNPFAVYFVPTEAPETTVSISDNAAGVLSLSQANQTLFITAAAQNWSSGEVIKITVATPAGRGQDLLLGLACASTAVFAPGFAPPQLTAYLNGASTLFADSISSDTVNLTINGASNAVLGGLLGTVNLNLEGATKVDVSGVNGTVNLWADGVSTANIYPAAESVDITGTVNGLATNNFYAGTCSVQAPSFMTMSTPCEKKDPASFPVPAQPTWACGVRISGADSVSAQQSWEYYTPDGDEDAHGGDTVGNFFNNPTLPSIPLEGDIGIDTSPPPACTASQSDLTIGS